MNKYINIIVISFFSILTIRYDIGYSLFIPVVLIFASVNSRSLMLFIPISLISVYIYKSDFLFSSIILFIFVFLYILFIEKKKSKIIDFVFVFLINISLIFIMKKSIDVYTLYLDVIIALVSAFMYIIIKYLIKINQGNFIYFEMMAIILSVLGASTIEYKYNISFIIAVFYAMYFTSNAGIIFSEVFSILITIFLIYNFKIEYALILPFISAIYILNNIICSFIVVIFSALIGVFYPQYFSIILLIDIVCIFFELCRYFLVMKRIKRSDTYEEIYHQSIQNLNNNILAFSGFLDTCTKDNIINKEYNQSIEDGVNSFKLNYCEKCYLNKKCHDKIDLVENDMRRLILDCRKSTFNISSLNNLGVCPYNIEMKKSSLIINNRINSLDLKNKNKIINNTLTNISAILKQYVIDNNIKKEIDYNYFYKLKTVLVENGYSVCFYDVIKVYEENFEIVIGIRGYNFIDIKQDIEEILKKVLPVSSSVEYSHSEKRKVYFKVLPQKNYNIDYSSSNIAYGEVSGDNILISEANNKFIAIISDGMGKGSKAHDISLNIINTIKELIKAEVSSCAIINILNTYSELKNTNDIYSTLDYLEINQQTKEAVFYKFSAAPSYIYHNSKYENRIEKIENNSLPIGCDNNIDNINVEIKDGDIIIMSSDGIFDNIINEQELENFISTITYLSVEKIVYQIMNYIKNSTKINDDDSSIIVIKISII